jgi:hypothetical protein
MYVTYWVVLVLMAAMWGQFQRQQRFCPPSGSSLNSGHVRAYLSMAKCQLMVSLFLLGMFAVAFLMFPWPVALLAIFVWLAVAVITC